MNGRVVQLATVVLGAALLYAAALFAPSINKGRESLNMIGRADPLENTPPEYAFAIQALGAFRGLITNIAFIRAEEFKRQGRYYDAMQLASWICKLQPRFPSVWEFHSWNMAWNISVTTYTPEERWNWVYNGAKLIRDEGLHYNPRAVNLYKQLAWIFLNKMGETLDEFHMAYKQNWAWRMHLLLGPPPDPLGSYRPDEKFVALVAEIGQDPMAEAARRARGEQARQRGEPLPAAPAAPSAPQDDRGPTPAEIAQKAHYEWVQALEQAPATLAQLYERFPETRRMVSELSELGIRISDETLTEDHYWREEGLAFRFFERYRRLTDPPSLLARVWKRADHDTDAQRLERFDRIVGVRAQDSAGNALLRFLQRKVLGEVYKMDPSHMALLVETFGPMDWRSVYSQSLYWATQSIIQGEETISSFRNDKTNTSRLLFFSLRGLYLTNKLTFEPYPENISLSYLNLSPDMNFIEPMHQAYLQYGPVIDPNPQKQGAGDTYRTGHINFLTEAIRLLYFADRKREAGRYFQYLRDAYGTNDDGTLQQNYAKSLRDFVFDSFFENVDTLRETTNVINALLVESFSELAQGNLAQYAALVGKAFDFHSQYMREQEKSGTTRMKMPPLVEMQTDRLRDWLALPPLSPGDTVQKARLWQYLPATIRQRVYDDVLEGLTRECEYWQFDVARAFPEPPGMAEYREQVGRRGPQQQSRTAETPAQQRE